MELGKTIEFPWENAVLLYTVCLAVEVDSCSSCFQLSLCVKSSLGLLGAVCDISPRAIQNPLIHWVLILEGYCESLTRMQ